MSVIKCLGHWAARNRHSTKACGHHPNVLPTEDKACYSISFKVLFGLNRPVCLLFATLNPTWDVALVRMGKIKASKAKFM